MSALNELSRLRRRGSPSTKSPAERNDGKAALFFLGPWFIGLIVIVAGPLAASFYLSFTEYNLLSAPTFKALENYQSLLNDEQLRKALQVTFTYVFVSVPMQLAAALGLALLLDRGLRGLAVYRSIYYLPSLLGGSVAIAILWRQIFGTSGLVNQVLDWFNSIQPVFHVQTQGWVSNPDTALGTLILLNVWTFGSPMVIFLAGLRQIPEMYYEAASIDGASRFRKLTKITLPLLTPIIFFNLVLQVINAFQTFTQSYIVSGGTGGPVDSTLFYTLYLYIQAFTNLNMGYASAMAWVLLLIVAVMTAVNFLLSKYWVFYND